MIFFHEMSKGAPLPQIIILGDIFDTLGFGELNLFMPQSLQDVSSNCYEFVDEYSYRFTDVEQHYMR